MSSELYLFVDGGTADLKFVVPLNSYSHSWHAGSGNQSWGSVMELTAEQKASKELAFVMGTGVPLRPSLWTVDQVHWLFHTHTHTQTQCNTHTHTHTHTHTYTQFEIVYRLLRKRFQNG